MVRSPSLNEMAMAKKLPITSTNMIVFSLSPNATIPNGTQQTLGSVCMPKNNGPKKSSMALNRHMIMPSQAPSAMLMANPISNLSPLTKLASTNALVKGL